MTTTLQEEGGRPLIFKGRTLNFSRSNITQLSRVSRRLGARRPATPSVQIRPRVDHGPAIPHRSKELGSKARLRCAGRAWRAGQGGRRGWRAGRRTSSRSGTRSEPAKFVVNRAGRAWRGLGKLPTAPEAAPPGNHSMQSKSCHSPRWCTCTSPWRGRPSEARPLVCGWAGVPGAGRTTPMCPAARAPAGGLLRRRAAASAFRRLPAPWDMHGGTEGQRWQSLAPPEHPGPLPCNPCTYTHADPP